MLANLETVSSSFDEELMALTRDFIQGPRLHKFTVDEIHVALSQSNLTEIIEDSEGQEQLLASIGIALIIDLFHPLGPGTVAITPAKSHADAQRLLLIISQETYHSFRKALGIEYHWVLQLNSESSPELDELMTKSMYWFHDYDQNPPECSVIEL
jgi:hypothetical protein